MMIYIKKVGRVATDNLYTGISITTTARRQLDDKDKDSVSEKQVARMKVLILASRTMKIFHCLVCIYIVLGGVC